MENRMGDWEGRVKPIHYGKVFDFGF